MKKLHSVKLLTVVLLSCAVTVGCAGQSTKDSASKTTSEASQSIKNASDAISMANENNWIWSNTEDLLKEAQAAAASGDNAKAIKLADQAKFQAEAALIQYNYEKDHPRGL
jgi:outer membrane PBP1 activator LpoA protein